MRPLFHWTLAASLALGVLGPSLEAQGAPCTGSSNVAIVDSPLVINGGTLPTGGSFATFAFSNLPVANLSAATLVAFDTLVLNVASPGMGCTTASLSASQKADINAFVSAGGKLIIYDSECTFGGSVDYSWLTFPFNTVNPGAQGFVGGTLTIVEENALSSMMPANAKYIDTNAIVTQTDAVGDMNVVDLTTVDPNWCLDMTGTNVLQFSGAVHMYARSGPGVVIYNGLDVDFIRPAVDPTGGGQLAKIWLHELETGCSAAELPCGIAVIGITLSPMMATNEVGEQHTVTALVTDILGQPSENVQVDFTILSGPNAGLTGSGLTDANGQVSFTYTGSGGVGTDNIQACFVDQFGTTICSSVVTKEWVTPPSLPGRMTGGGSVFQQGTGQRFTHGFTLRCCPGEKPNRLQINWSGNRFHLTRLDTALCSDDPNLSEGKPVAGFDTFEGTGVGRLNGVDGAMITFKFTDDGEPGKGVDLAEFTIDDGVNPPIVVSGYLNKGNHQAHAASCTTTAGSLRDR